MAGEGVLYVHGELHGRLPMLDEGLLDPPGVLSSIVESIFVGG